MERAKRVARDIAPHCLRNDQCLLFKQKHTSVA